MGSIPADYDLSLNPMFKFIPELPLLSKEERAEAVANKNSLIYN